MLDLTYDAQTDAAGSNARPAVSVTKLRGISICGSHIATKALAPFSDSSILIYACSPDNSPYGMNGPPQCSPLPRVDQFFEIHRPIFDKTRPYAYLEWLSMQPFKLWVRDEVAFNLRRPDGHPLFPNAEIYPEKAVKQRFGHYVFTSSIAFMMAKAIMDIEVMVDQGIMGADGEPPELALYGILQASKNEYVKQRQGTQQMLWNATQSGIKVKVARESGLFEPPPEDF